MERDRQPHLITFFTDAAIAEGSTIALSESAAHHARVRRVRVSDGVRLTDGRGHIGIGSIVAVARETVAVDVAEVSLVPKPSAVQVRAPIGDRDRMLWLAEKATELGITNWQAVRFARSASVSPRGEGPAFAAKVRARMIAALEQSGGAWLPNVLADSALGSIDVTGGEPCILLDRDGPPLASLLGLSSSAEPVILLGPEGGLEAGEVEALTSTGWQRASLGDTTLRFETAGVAAIAVCRALLTHSRTRGMTNG